MNNIFQHPGIISLPPAYVWDDVGRDVLVAIPHLTETTPAHMNMKQRDSLQLILNPLPFAEDNLDSSVLGHANAFLSQERAEIVGLTQGSTLFALTNPIEIRAPSAIPTSMIKMFASEKDRQAMLAHTNACGCAGVKLFENLQRQYPDPKALSNAASKPMDLTNQVKPLQLSDGTNVTSQAVAYNAAQDKIVEAETQHGIFISHPIDPRNSHLQALTREYAQQRETLKNQVLQHTNTLSGDVKQQDQPINTPGWRMMRLRDYSATMTADPASYNAPRMLAAIMNPDAPDKAVQAYFNLEGRMIVPKQDMLIARLPETVARVHTAPNTRHHLNELLSWAKSQPVGTSSALFTTSSVERAQMDFEAALPERRVREHQARQMAGQSK